MGSFFTWSLLLQLVLLPVALYAQKQCTSTIEPYGPLNGGAFVGPDRPFSPDPLVRYVWSPSVNTSQFQVYCVSPIAVDTDTPISFVGLGSLTTDHQYVRVVGPGSIRLDFGVEHAAWLEFDSPDLAAAGAEVTLSISEFNEVGYFGSYKTAAPVRYADTYRVELNAQLYEGVRFGWITVKALNWSFSITAVRLVCQIKPTNYVGHFASSEQLLDRIWYTAVYTVKLNLLQDYFGAILIYRGDRYSWTGDAHVAQAAALTAFADYDFVAANIRRTANDSNGIESYAMYWVLSVLEYTRFSGDSATLLGYADNIDAKLLHARSVLDRASLAFYGWDDRIGAGFEDASCPEGQRAYRMLAARAHAEYSAALQAYGFMVKAQQYATFAAEMVDAARTRADWYTDWGLHAAAEAINTGLLTDGEAAALGALQFNDVNRICSLSSFNQYWVLQALGRLGYDAKAVETVRRCWGGQIALGASTFWEVYSPQWNDLLLPGSAVPNCENGWTSLCHPWSAGAAPWLSAQVAGVTHTWPSAATGEHGVIIAPLAVCSGPLFVDAAVPTPRGLVQVQLNVTAGALTVSVPSGVSAQALKVPLLTCHSGHTVVGVTATTPAADGAAAPTLELRFLATSTGQVTTKAECVACRTAGQESVLAALASTARVEKGKLILYSVPSGRYTFQLLSTESLSLATPEAPALTAPAAASAPFPPAVWPGVFLGADTTTSGDWPGRYGRDGYVLFSYDGEGQHLEKLPSYVKSVSPVYHAVNKVLATNTTDPRAPASPYGHSHARTVAIATADYTFPIDIQFSGTVTYQVALYYLDWDHTAMRQTVDVMDLATLNNVVPTQLVQDAAGGVYLVFSGTGSGVRVRMSLIRSTGGSAQLNAVFFDPAAAQAVQQ